MQYKDEFENQAFGTDAEPLEIEWDKRLEKC